ncbi:MAG: GGDEF domain-containing protein [Spirochaetia bacterium]|jgi:diguanylate cyclase (GGDEF)-like protein
MPSAEKDKPNLMDNLLRQGVAPEDIKKVYRSLREKGYGEEEARRRSNAALEQWRAQKAIEERRRSSTLRTLPPAAGPGATSARKPGAEPARKPGAAADDRGRRAVDWLPEIPSWLRRRINRYAFRNGFLITRLPERFDDFISLFDRARGDYANRALIRLLADEKGYRGGNPFHLSFIDTLDALRFSAGRFLGRRAPASAGRQSDAQSTAGADALASLQAREPFAVEYFTVFTQPYEMLRVSLAHLCTSLRARRRVSVAELARVVKDGCRLSMITAGIEQEKLETVIDVAREVNLAHDAGPRAATELAEAEGLFRAGLQNLRRVAHELYPALLKMIAGFYLEQDASPDKTAAVRELLEVREEDILTWEGWQRRMRELREKEMRERQARELARLEQEKAEKISARFEGTFAMLSSLFPGSGIERIDQGEFVLPYFSNRVFTRTPAFQARAADLELLSSTDIMGLILVFHSFLDDLLSSLDPYALEKCCSREGLAAGFVSLRAAWRDAYPRLFEPYLDAVREYARELEGDPRMVKLFRESERARGIEERINQLRNRAIRNFGHIVSARELYDGPKLFELAAHLSELLTEAGRAINQSTIAAQDPVSRKIMADLEKTGIVDFIAAARPGSVDFRPVTRQIKRWIEARHRGTVLDIPGKAQVAYMDVFRGVAYLYDSLLNDPKGPAARTGHGAAVASPEDRAAWDKEHAARGRDTLASLQATLMEQFPGQFIDALTGLRNKDYFLNELPRKLERMRARRTPLAFLMIDIDHFKWVNDTLGHPRGDDILKATAGMLLDNIREGDLAVRYGGEEMLVVVPSDLHTGIILAERLRFAQEGRVLAREGMQDVRKVGEEGGQPCGTLSIGVADVTGILELQKAVEKVDKALYAAKRSRNTVVFIEPGKADKTAEKFVTYAEYRRRSGVAPS